MLAAFIYSLRLPRLLLPMPAKASSTGSSANRPWSSFDSAIAADGHSGGSGFEAEAGDARCGRSVAPEKAFLWPVDSHYPMTKQTTVPPAALADPSATERISSAQ